MYRKVNFWNDETEESTTLRTPPRVTQPLKDTQKNTKLRYNPWFSLSRSIGADIMLAGGGIGCPDGSYSSGQMAWI